MADMSEWSVDDWVKFYTPRMRPKPPPFTPPYQQRVLADLVTQCNTCGSVVTDKVMHTNWHEKLRKEMRFDPRDALGWTDGH